LEYITKRIPVSLSAISKYNKRENKAIDKTSRQIIKWWTSRGNMQRSLESPTTAVIKNVRRDKCEHAECVKWYSRQIQRYSEDRRECWTYL